MSIKVAHLDHALGIRNCRAWRAPASGERLMIASHPRFCIYIYLSIYIYVRTLRKQVLQLHKLGWYSCASLMAAPCAEWYIALSRAARSSVASSALWYFFHRQSTASRSAFAVAGALPPPLCCALVQCAVASC